MVSVLLALILCTGLVQARSWTDSRGNTLEADYVSFDPEREEVVLQGKDGAKKTFSLRTLAEEDQKAIKELWAESLEKYAIVGSVEIVFPSHMKLKISPKTTVVVGMYDPGTKTLLTKSEEQPLEITFPEKHGPAKAEISFEKVALDPERPLQVQISMTASAEEGEEKVYPLTKVENVLRLNEKGEIDLGSVRFRLNRSDFR